MQGIFSRRLRKRINANTLTNGQTDKQTDKQTHRQNIMRCQKWHGHRNSEKYLDVAIVLFAYYYCKVILECQTGDNNFLQAVHFCFISIFEGAVYFVLLIMYNEKWVEKN